MSLRNTKIVATLGPASNSEFKITEMIQAGVNVFRLNFSHGEASDHIKTAETIRSVATRLMEPVGILCDLQGPKIRIGRFENKSIELKIGDIFVLDNSPALGNQLRVGLDYEPLLDEVTVDDVLLLDDGRIELIVNKVERGAIYCIVKFGGTLSNNKGINKKGGGLSADALTDKDRSDLKTAANLGADFIAISFPRNAEDMLQAKQLIQAAGSTAKTVAKIERAEAVKEAESITVVSDAIMVARGDLGVEVGDAAVPGIQKKLINLARKYRKPIITATQMMESMITNPIPTRAEVSDVANAIIDGTDAVMLSAETAVGGYPIATVAAVERVAIDAEAQCLPPSSASRRIEAFSRVDEAIAMSTMYAAEHLPVKAIATLTQSGTTAQWLSSAQNAVPVYALSPDVKTIRSLTLCRGICPLYINDSNKTTAELLKHMQQVLLQNGVVESGDVVVMTFGEPIGTQGGTNTMKIIKID